MPRLHSLARQVNSPTIATSGLQLDAELVSNPRLRLFHERDDIRGSRAAKVKDEVRVLVRELSVAEAMPAQANLVDVPPGRVVRRVLENRAAVASRRLSAPPLFVQLAHALLQRPGIAALEPKVHGEHDLVADRRRA